MTLLLSPSDRVWIRQGIDIGLIRENLALSYEDRIAQHQRLLEVIDVLHSSQREPHAKSSAATDALNQKPN